MRRYRSKTLATWLAVAGGVFGMHRFYLHGLADRIGWLFPLPTLVGLYGLNRIDALGQDDRLAWLLLPLLGATITIAMLSAIVYGLTPDPKWDARHNAGLSPGATGWGPILGVIAALLLGSAALVSTVAFGFQKLFETLT